MKRFSVDTDACQGHGRCYALDPEHFEDDEDGYPVVRDVPVADAAGERIVNECPERAISLVPADG